MAIDPVFARPLRAAIRQQPTAVLYRATPGAVLAQPVTGSLGRHYEQIPGLGRAGVADSEIRFEYVTADLPQAALQGGTVTIVAGGAHAAIADGAVFLIKSVQPDDGGCTLLVLGRG